jgi:hypothetical protein
MTINMLEKQLSCKYYFFGQERWWGEGQGPEVEWACGPGGGKLRHPPGVALGPPSLEPGVTREQIIEFRGRPRPVFKYDIFSNISKLLAKGRDSNIAVKNIVLERPGG